MIPNGTFLLEGSGISISICYDQEFCQMDSTEDPPGWPCMPPPSAVSTVRLFAPYSQDSCVGSESGHTFTWKSLHTCVCFSLFRPPRQPLDFANFGCMSKIGQCVLLSQGFLESGTQRKANRWGSEDGSRRLVLAE